MPSSISEIRPTMRAYLALKRLLLLVPLVLIENVLHAGYPYGEFAITDTYVSSPTMLVRVSSDGQIREIWSGMDAKRMRQTPLFLATSVFGEVRRGGEWTDLRKLKYHHAGTRPGFIHMESDDGLVAIEITSRRNAALSPIFVKYTFSVPVDLRLSAHFKRPEFTKEARSADEEGYSAFSTQWSEIADPAIGKDGGPRLVLATQPLGRTLSIDKTGLVKQIESAREVLLCIDATDMAVNASGSEGHTASWIKLLGGCRDSDAEVSQNHVSLTSDDRKLDRLLECSIDGVESLQFASGLVIADIGKYRNSWLRDGCYSIIGLALAGNYAAVDRYFAFWDAKRNFFVGGDLEAQQPAIGITAMWYYSRLDPNGPAFLEQHWSLVKYYADYYKKRIEKEEGMLHLGEEWIENLPAPTSWPNAEVYSGLRAAAKIADQLGDVQEAQGWNRAADTLKERFAVQAYDKDKGRIIPLAGPAGQSYTSPDHPTAPNQNGPLRDDRVDSGVLNTARLEAFGRGQGIISVDDPKFASTQAQVIRDLELPDHSLLAFGPNPANPHSPRGMRNPDGFRITFLPVNAVAVQDEWLLGRTDLAWTYLLSGIMNKRGYDLAAMNYSLPEDWDERGVPGEPMYSWCHGEFITSTLLLFLGLDLEPRTADLGLAPSLPPGMNHAQIGNFHYRNWRLNIELNRRQGCIDVAVLAANPEAVERPLAIRLPDGAVVKLKAGQTARFTVDPRQYYQAFGRSKNAAQRVSIISRILGGKEPAFDPGKMTPSEQEEFMCNLETAYAPH